MNVGARLLAESIEAEAFVLTMIHEDCPDYDARVQKKHVDLRWQKAVALFEVDRSQADQIDQQLNAKYEIPTEPQINSPVRLRWKISNDQFPFHEMNGGGDDLIRRNRESREIALELCAAELTAQLRRRDTA